MPSIMVRAKITRDEWERLRILAIRQGRAPSDIVGELIRTYLGSHDPEPQSLKA